MLGTLTKSMDFRCQSSFELGTFRTSNFSAFGFIGISANVACRLAAVHLVDAHLCTDAAKYISALLLSLNVMLSLGLPHVNVLSKFDLITSFGGDLAFNLEYYTEVHHPKCITHWLGLNTMLRVTDCFQSALRTISCCAVQVQDLSYLVDSMGDGIFSARYKSLSRNLCEVSLNFFFPVTMTNGRQDPSSRACLQHLPLEDM